MKKQSVALVIIYNHRFDKNIDILERIYRGRFSNIFHLVPFYSGTKDNVIPVFESSFYFQGYVAQGFKGFKGSSYRHYFFVADDMILNPVINEENYSTIFDLDGSTGFIPELDSMPAPRWPHNRAAMTFDPFRPGVEVRNEIPSAAIAAKAIEKHSVKNGPFKFIDTYFWNRKFGPHYLIYQIIRFTYDRLILKAKLGPPKYPFVRSYSDIFIVPSLYMDPFVQYCGAFAATDLWVELAIPTALVLTGAKIRVQSQLKLRGRPLWTAEDYKILEEFDNKLLSLLENFPMEYIYLHPIKLSKWDVAL